MKRAHNTKKFEKKLLMDWKPQEPCFISHGYSRKHRQNSLNNWTNVYLHISGYQPYHKFFKIIFTYITNNGSQGKCICKKTKQTKYLLLTSGQNQRVISSSGSKLSKEKAPWKETKAQGEATSLMSPESFCRVLHLLTCELGGQIFQASFRYSMTWILQIFYARYSFR